MTVVEKISPKIRIVKFHPIIYKRPFVVQRKIDCFWFNAPIAANPMVFETQQAARTFAKEFVEKQV